MFENLESKVSHLLIVFNAIKLVSSPAIRKITSESQISSLMWIVAFQI
jgi:hypothetical protein